MIAAILVAAVLIIATILAILAVSTARQEATGRHARPFADPADVTDPDGTQFLAVLHHEPPPKDAEVNPDATVRLPHAHGTWGKSVTELLDELEATYMEVKR